jgi:hypothetical protein
MSELQAHLADAIESLEIARDHADDPTRRVIDTVLQALRRLEGTVSEHDEADEIEVTS